MTGQPERTASDKTDGRAQVDILQKPFETDDLRAALAAVFSRVEEAA